MAGFTNFTTTKLNGKTILVPIIEVLEDKVIIYQKFPKKIEKDNRMWQRLLTKTK